MNKKFRAWDGEQYWYADDNLQFICGDVITELLHATFELKDVEMFTGKMDSKGTMIYENDLLQIILPNTSKIYQVIWSDEACGFRKVPYSLPFPETKIDSAFMEVVGTINSQK